MEPVEALEFIHAWLCSDFFKDVRWREVLFILKMNLGSATALQKVSDNTFNQWTFHSVKEDHPGLFTFYISIMSCNLHRDGKRIIMFPPSTGKSYLVYQNLDRNNSLILHAAPKSCQEVITVGQCFPVCNSLEAFIWKPILIVSNGFARNLFTQFVSCYRRNTGPLRYKGK